MFAPRSSEAIPKNLLAIRGLTLGLLCV